MFSPVRATGDSHRAEVERGKDTCEFGSSFRGEFCMSGIRSQRSMQICGAKIDPLTTNDYFLYTVGSGPCSSVCRSQIIPSRE